MKNQANKQIENNHNLKKYRIYVKKFKNFRKKVKRERERHISLK